MAGGLFCIDPSMFLNKLVTESHKQFLSVCAHTYELTIFVLLSSRSIDTCYKLACRGRGCSSQNKILIMIFLYNVGLLKITTF